MQQGSLERIDLLVHHHDRRVLAALDLQVENGVVARRAVDDLQNVTGIDRNADGLLMCPVQDGRDLSFAARAARLILTAGRTHVRGHDYIRLHYLHSPYGADVGSARSKSDSPRKTKNLA